MIRPRALLLAIAMALAAAPALADDDDDDDDHDDDREVDLRELVRTGQVLPLSAILEIVAREVPGEPIDVELDEDDDRYVYEIEVLAPNGRVLEVEIDAASGAILEVEED